MALKDRIKEARLANGFTQEQLANKIGIAKSTLAGYEKGNREPNLETTIKLMSVLGIDANYLWQDEMSELCDKHFSPSMCEIELIEKYRFISEYSPDGIETIKYILDREYKIAEQIKELSLSNADSNVRYIQRYPRLASAGTGQVVFEDMPVEQIAIPDIPEYKRVSYAIEVNGNSMEPVYHDEDVLLVEPACQIDVDEIGIFIVGNDAYVKKLGDGELISLNKGYSNIPLTEDSKCMGRVVDKL